MNENIEASTAAKPDHPARRREDSMLLAIVQTQAEINNKLDTLLRAFPKDREGNADVDGHCDYHTKLIENAAEIAAIKRESVRKIVSTGAASGLALMLYALWDYIKAHLVK